MNTHSDIKLTDQLERELIERELGTQSLGIAHDIKRAIATMQAAITRLQTEARRAKVAFANG